MAAPTIGSVLRSYVGSYLGFNDEVKQAKDAQAKAEQSRDAAQTETAKNAAARVDAEAKAAALSAELDKNNQARASDFVVALEKCMADVRAGVGGSVVELNSVHDAAFAFKMSSHYHDKKFNDVMDAGIQMIVEKTRAAATKASADYEKAKANFRGAEIGEYRKKYNKVLGDARGDLALSSTFTVLTGFTWLLFSDAREALAYMRTRVFRLEKALDQFNELVKDLSWSPTEAFKKANDNWFIDESF